MPPVERFILDTSVFTNPDVFTQFGADAQAAIRVFSGLARRAPAEFYMPGSVYEELRVIKDVDNLAADYEMVVKIRSPRKHNLMIPGDFLYELIDEVRQRINSGLRVAEEHARMAGGVGEDQDHLITRLRERYRETLRRGILDSKEDVDVLLLAYELDGVLVSSDEGLSKWADKVGVKIINPRHLRRVIEGLIEYKPATE